MASNVEKICGHCQKQYLGHPNSKFCSDKHYSNCEKCHKEFFLRKNQFKTICPQCSRGEATSRQMAKYGSAFSRPEVREKIKQNNLEKYGMENAGGSPAALEKIRKTNLERYGVASNFEREDFKEKSRKTILEKYGVDYISQDPEIRARITATKIERYGTQPNAAKQKETNLASGRRFVSDEVFIDYVESFSEKFGRKPTLTELAKNFGYGSTSGAGNHINRLDLKGFIDYRISSTNLYWHALLLDKLGVDFSAEGQIFDDKRKRCDFYLEERKLAIDINPTITHSTQKTIAEYYKPVSVKYHQSRALEAEKNGWLLYQIWDWSDEDQVIQQLKNILHLNEDKFQARKCQIVRPSIEEARDFLKLHHLQKDRTVGKIIYGLEFGGELVQVMTFSNVRFKKEEGFELIRLASRGTVAGGASRLFRAFVRDFDPTRVKTFASLDSGQGKVYEKLGFDYDGLAALNGLYARPDTGEAFKVSTCSIKFSKEYNALGLTQQEYMNGKGFYRINDAGNKIFVWTKPE